MLPNGVMKAVFWLSFAAVMVAPVLAQDAGVLNPPSSAGPNPLMTGVFVTPVPKAPFSATVVLASTRRLQDGSTENFKTVNLIARDATGRIYNERRRLVPASFSGTPQVLSIHLYDPETRVNSFLNPFQHIARQSTLKGPAPFRDDPPKNIPQQSVTSGNSPVREEDLGTQIMEDVTVRGRKIIRTIPEALSGTGQPLVVTDEYWYSDDLHLNMLIKHNDPRTGEQTATVTDLKRAAPDAGMFKIPADYKVVNETPED